MTPEQRKELEEQIREIKYQVLSWHLDEGDYQPTEPELNEKLKSLLRQAEAVAVRAFVERVKEMMPKWWHMTESDIKRLNQDLDQTYRELYPKEGKK